MALLTRRPHTDRIVEAVKRWADQEEGVEAVVLYGSVHRQSVHAHSDVDLIIVCSSGERDPLWTARQEMAATFLGESPAWSHELEWQGPYRFQAWTSSLAAVDLTLDEDGLTHHDVLANGYTLLYGTLSEALPARSTTPAWWPSDELDGETWVWLLGLHGQLLQGRHWEVFSGLVQLIDVRLRPLMPDAGSEVLTAIVPVSLDPTALLGALRATTVAYDRLCESCGLGRSRMALADQIRAMIHTEQENRWA